MGNPKTQEKRQGRAERKGKEGSVWPQWRARHWIHSTQHREKVGELRQKESSPLKAPALYPLSVSNRACFSF